MPSTNYVLNLLITFLVNRAITVRLHQGDPGANGANNQVAVNGYAAQNVALADWAVDANTGHAEIEDDLDFGTFLAVANGVSHYSLWDGNNFMASRAFAAPMNIAANRIARVQGRTIDYEVTSIA